MTTASFSASDPSGYRRSALLEWVVAVLACGALAAFFFRDFWTPAVFLSANDIAATEYLRWEWGWKSFFATGHLPLWNPFLFGGGYPFVASFSFSPFYPPVWLFLALPTALALTGRLALGVALGGVGFFAFARVRGLRFPVALAAALLYESGGHILTLAFPGHLQKVEAIAWLPWAMAACVMLTRDGRMRWAVGLGVAWALQLLASHSQIFYATFWLSGGYLVSATLWGGEGRARGRALAGMLGRVTLAALVAGGLSAAQLWPSLDMASESNRGSGGLRFEEASAGALPMEELAEQVLPSFRGDSTKRLLARNTGLRSAKPLPFPYVGRWHADVEGSAPERLVSDYAGVWAFLLALGGVVLGTGRARWFFLGAGGTALWVSVGHVAPEGWPSLFSTLFHWLPGFNRFRSPATFMIVAHFSFSALSALGIEVLMRRLTERPVGRSARTTLAILFLAAIVAFVVWGGLRAREVGIPLMAPTRAAFIERARSLLWMRSLEHVALFFGLGSALLGLLLFNRGMAKRLPGSETVLFLALLGVVVLDPLSQAGRFLPKGDTRAYERTIRTEWPHLAIQADAGDALLPGLMDEGNELNNWPLLNELRTVYGYHPVVYGAYAKLLDVCGYDSMTVARLFAINYRVRNASEPIPAGWRDLKTQGKRRVQVREAKIPFARLPRQVVGLDGSWEQRSKEEWKELLTPETFDPARLTWCENGFNWPTRTDSTEASSISLSTPWPAVHATMPRPGEFDLTLDSTATLPAGQTFYPCLLPVSAGRGWRVEMNSSDPEHPEQKPAVDLKLWPRRANGLFALAPVQPGMRTRLIYDPQPQRVGLALSLATVLGLLVGGILVSRRRRRRTSEAQTTEDSERAEEDRGTPQP